MSESRRRRIAAAWRAADAAGLDALLITNPANILYLSGFGGTAGRLLLRRGRLYFITDFRYSRTVQALAGAWPVDSEVIEITGSYDDALAALARRVRIRTLGFEAASVTVAQHRAWCDRLAGVTLVSTDDVVCLLYTSPSPRDGLLSRMPSSA